MAKPVVEVFVGGQRFLSATYVTAILKSNLNFDQQIGNENTKYVIKWDFDLQGKIITIPKNCIIDFDGGSVRNGTLVGQDTLLINTGDIPNIFRDGAIRTGTWRERTYGGSGDGKSAYELAVENGFEGTEEEWLASLKGSNGTNGENAISVQILSDKGMIFKNKSTEVYTLTAHVFDGKNEITDDIPLVAFSWTKTDSYGNPDYAWNDVHTRYGNTLQITCQEVPNMSLIECLLDLSYIH